MPRTTLTRDRVVRAAIALADADGLDAISMRRVGQELGVEAMSLYNHVRNKEDLLDGMVDVVFGEFVLPELGRPWRDAVRDRCTSALEVLRRHPWATGLLDSRSTPGMNNLRHHDAMLGCLRAAGFSWELTAHAFAVLDSYVYGFAIQEAALPFDAADEVGTAAEAIVAQIPVDVFPNLAGMAAHATSTSFSFSDEFDFGLDLVLDGLARALAEAG